MQRTRGEGNGVMSSGPGRPRRSVYHKIEKDKPCGCVTLIMKIRNPPPRRHVHRPVPHHRHTAAMTSSPGASSEAKGKKKKSFLFWCCACQGVVLALLAVPLVLQFLSLQPGQPFALLLSHNGTSAPVNLHSRYRGEEYKRTRQYFQCVGVGRAVDSFRSHRWALSACSLLWWSPPAGGGTSLCTTRRRTTTGPSSTASNNRLMDPSFPLLLVWVRCCGWRGGVRHHMRLVLTLLRQQPWCTTRTANASKALCRSFLSVCCVFRTILTLSTWTKVWTRVCERRAVCVCDATLIATVCSAQSTAAFRTH